MNTNFDFLKKVNSNLYEIISEAEKLYRDEYFEQCMTQTRRFGENICKEMLEENNLKTGSFDEMLATLKDRSHGYEQEKEFIGDLYFLKKYGNQSVHSDKIKKDGITALECLKRAFEVAINYSVYNKNASTDILKLNYDVELLVTENKSKPSLKEKYEKEKQKVKLQKNPITAEPVKKSEQKYNNNYTDIKNYRIPFFWKAVTFLTIVSVVTIVIISILIF